MELKYNNQVYDVDFEKIDNAFASTINGTATDLRINEMQESIYRVVLGGKMVNAFAIADREHVYVSLDGHSFVFDKPGEDEKSYGDSAADANREEIRTPMPGSVVKVLVEPDQQVEEGDGLIIVEAMKMESTLFSSISGVVTEVNAKAGEQVDSDLILVLVEKVEES
jgi:biotin carboxyl carrier protein